MPRPLPLAMADPLVEPATPPAREPREIVPLPLEMELAPRVVRDVEGGAMVDLFGRVVRGVGGFSTKLVSVVLCDTVSNAFGQSGKNAQKGSIDVALAMVQVRRHGVLLSSLVPSSLGSTLEALNAGRLWEINTESAHVHAVQESAETFVEAIQALVQQLQVHHIGL